MKRCPTCSFLCGLSFGFVFWCSAFAIIKPDCREFLLVLASLFIVAGVFVGMISGHET